MENTNRSVKKYLLDIQNRKRDTRWAEHIIAEHKKAYEKAIAAPKEFLKNNEIELNYIRNQIVIARMVDIIEILAEVWNSTPEELDVHFMTDLDTSRDVSDEEFMNEVNNSQKHGLANFTFLISKLNKTKGYNKLREMVTIDNPIDLSAVQADGRTFLEHTHVESSEIAPGIYDTTLEIDDYRDILVRYPLRDLITENDESARPKNVVSKAILEASEKLLTHNPEVEQELN